MFRKNSIRTGVALAAVLFAASSGAKAQGSDIFGKYASEKGVCEQQGALIEISRSKITGPGFDCRLGESRPAGTGLVFYEAQCTVDDRRSSKGLALDLGNYADRFMLSLPGRQDWIPLFPCKSGSGAKRQDGKPDTAAKKDDDVPGGDESGERVGGSQATPKVERSPAVASYLKRYNDFITKGGIAEIAAHSLIVEACAGCVPYIINCRKPISRPGDLAGRKSRVSNHTRTFVTQNGGAGVLIAGGEVRTALQVGVIDCAVAGGFEPQQQ